MDWVINGLPVHPLLVHATVIVIPLAALCAVLSLVWPTARRRLGIVTPILAAAALVATAVTVQAGEAFAEIVTPTALSGAHVSIGETVTPWVVALFLVACLQWLWFRYFTGDGRYASRVRSAGTRRALTVVLAVLVAGSAIGSVTAVVVVGESGARAVWSSTVDGAK